MTTRIIVGNYAPRDYLYVVFCSGQYEEHKETRYWLVSKFWEFVLGLRSWYRLDPRCVTAIWTTKDVFDQMTLEDMNNF